MDRTGCKRTEIKCKKINLLIREIYDFQNTTTRGLFMKSIYKFYLGHPEKNFIFVPLGSKILCVQNQKEKAAI